MLNDTQQVRRRDGTRMNGSSVRVSVYIDRSVEKEMLDILSSTKTFDCLSLCCCSLLLLLPIAIRCEIPHSSLCLGATDIKFPCQQEGLKCKWKRRITIRVLIGEKEQHASLRNDDQSSPSSNWADTLPILTQTDGAQRTSAHGHLLSNNDRTRRFHRNDRWKHRTCLDNFFARR